MTIKKSFFVLIILLQLPVLSLAATEHAWQKHSQGINEAKVNCLLVDIDGSYVLAGTDKAIYRAIGESFLFNPTLQNHGNNPAVHQITQNIASPFSIYAATDSGVFESIDKGKTWANIFSSGNALARHAFCVLGDAEAVYVGTADGLYVRQQDEKDWKKDSGPLGRQAVFNLGKDEQYIYAATSSQVLRISKNSDAVKKVYSLGDRLIDENQVVSDDDAIRQKQIKDMFVSVDQKIIFVVTEQKILSSHDNGDTFSEISSLGLPVELVAKIFVKNERLYAATEKGFYVLQNDRWQQQSSGLTGNFINDVRADRQGNLYLASSDGFFTKSNSSQNVSRNIGKSSFEPLFEFKNEPTIKEVQQMAIEYANVNPKQIKSWHNQSRAKALFPTVSVGFSRADTDLYHWDTGPNPDVLTKGRDFMDWSTSVSWDFGDLVWSSDRTSIDSRSKLMSELRQDILDQVTRLYFERRRVEIELKMKEDLDDEVYLDRQMRKEELTALIDGLTGGKFSKYTLKK